MKGPQLLITLLLLGAAAAIVLILRAPSLESVAEHPSGEIYRFVCHELDRSPAQSPSIGSIPAATVANQIADVLAHRFGEDGLARRSRAYALLHLLPEGQDLQDQLARALASGNRGVAKGPGEPVLHASDLDLTNTADQARLARLMTQALLGPPPPGPDDAYLARWALLGGISAEIEARYLAKTPGASPFPSEHEVAHEVLLLNLPIYTHNLVQLPLMEGRDTVRRRLAAGESFAEILAAPPQHTLALLAPAAIPDAPPELPGHPGQIPVSYTHLTLPTNTVTWGWRGGGAG